MTPQSNYRNLEFAASHSGIMGLYAPVADYSSKLAPAEAKLVASSVKKRRAEFSTGRLLAHEGLALLGLSTPFIAAGKQRQPLWPDSVVGSISHTDQLAVVAVAPRTQFLGIGLDIEKFSAVDDTLIPKLLTPNERSGDTDTDATLIFSAKESVYKFIYPILGQFMDFQDVEISIHRDTSCFTARYLGDNPANRIIEHAKGVFMPLAGHWLTLIAN